jgi:hypothetical protein
LNDIFFALGDKQRWQVVNLLHLDASPMLWFYLRPNRDGRGARVSEADRNRIFLDSVLDKPSAVQRRYVLGDDGEYELSRGEISFRNSRPRTEVQAIWDRVDGQRTGKEIFEEIGRSEDFNSVYQARVMLATTECPHLMVRA